MLLSSLSEKKMQDRKNEDYLFPNFRDLGGFCTRDGRCSKTGMYFRSGAPKQLKEEEMAFLRQKGIKTVLDFRIDEERKEWSEKEQYEVDCIRIPYYDRDSIALIRQMEEHGYFDWARIYTRVLDEAQDWIRSVFIALSLSNEAVLFHCASGKDRTGIVAALLLELLQAEDVWILTDYAVTWYSLNHDGSGFYETSPKTMRTFLETLRNQYGGAENYLIHTGVPINLLQKIRQRFLL